MSSNGTWAGLLQAVNKAASDLAAGQATAVGVISAKVVVLTEGVLKAMLLSKFKMAAAVAFLMIVICSAGVLVSHGVEGKNDPVVPKQVKDDNEKPKKADADWDMQVLKGHSGMVRFAAFSPNGKIVATGALVSGNGEMEDEVIIWDVKAHKLKHKLKLKSPVTLYQLAFSPDGKTLAIGTNGEVELRDAETGEVKCVLKGHRAGTGVFSLAFSPDGKTLASGGSATEKTVRLWDLQTGKLKWTFEGHSDEVVGLAFSPDGKTLASTGGQDDPTIRLWDVETGKPKLTLKVDYLPWSSSPLAFSPDGKILAKGSGALVVFFDAQTGEVKDKLITEQESGSILESLAFSPDGKLVAGGRTSGQIDVWETRPADDKFDWRAGDLKQTLKKPSRGVMSIAFSPSGDLLASGDRDGVVRVWKLKK
jgi:WD40 repeat protein